MGDDDGGCHKVEGEERVDGDEWMMELERVVEGERVLEDEVIVDVIGSKIPFRHSSDKSF